MKVALGKTLKKYSSRIISVSQPQIRIHFILDSALKCR